MEHAAAETAGGADRGKPGGINVEVVRDLTSQNCSPTANIDNPNRLVVITVYDSPLFPFSERRE